MDSLAASGCPVLMGLSRGLPVRATVAEQQQLQALEALQGVAGFAIHGSSFLGLITTVTTTTCGVHGFISGLTSGGWEWAPLSTCGMGLMHGVLASAAFTADSERPRTSWMPRARRKVESVCLGGAVIVGSL